MTHTKHRKRRARAARALQIPGMPELLPWQQYVLDKFIPQQHDEHVHLSAEQLHEMGWRNGGYVREQRTGIWTAPLGTPTPDYEGEKFW